jgi:hypothetical protein
MKVLAKVLTFERFIGQDNKQGLSEKFGGQIFVSGALFFPENVGEQGGRG